MWEGILVKPLCIRTVSQMNPVSAPPSCLQPKRHSTVPAESKVLTSFLAIPVLLLQSSDTFSLPANQRVYCLKFSAFRLISYMYKKVLMWLPESSLLLTLNFLWLTCWFLGESGNLKAGEVSLVERVALGFLSLPTLKAYSLANWSLRLPFKNHSVPSVDTSSDVVPAQALLRYIVHWLGFHYVCVLLNSETIHLHLGHLYSIVFCPFKPSPPQSYTSCSLPRRWRFLPWGRRRGDFCEES